MTNETTKGPVADVRKRKYTKKRGRPAGSKNRIDNVPTSETILKMTEENFEMALQEIRYILEDNPLQGQTYSEKHREMALKTSVELGKYFKELELSGKLSSGVSDSSKAKPEEQAKTPTKASVFALATHTESK